MPKVDTILSAVECYGCVPLGIRSPKAWRSYRFQIFFFSCKCTCGRPSALPCMCKSIMIQSNMSEKYAEIARHIPLYPRRLYDNSSHLFPEHLRESHCMWFSRSQCDSRPYSITFVLSGNGVYICAPQYSTANGLPLWVPYCCTWENHLLGWVYCTNIKLIMLYSTL